MLTQEYLKSIIHYDPETGLFSWLQSTSFRIKIGDIAGSKTIHNYLVIRINGKIYYAHRLAFLYVTGEWPEKHVDHIDLNRTNNKWLNIRPSTVSENHGNMNKHIDNTSGHKGVWFNKLRNTWNAQIMVKGKRYNLGVYENKEDAAKAYEEAAIKYFGEFSRV